MATMNISLPDQLKAFVEAQTEDGKYANSSDYVRDLIRRDAIKREKLAAMQEKIDEGMKSGYTDIENIDAFISEVFDEALRDTQS